MGPSVAPEDPHRVRKRGSDPLLSEPADQRLRPRDRLFTGAGARENCTVSIQSISGARAA
jgi:hypothetical protein